jgi:hypothetical protein
MLQHNSLRHQSLGTYGTPEEQEQDRLDVTVAGLPRHRPCPVKGVMESMLNTLEARDKQNHPLSESEEKTMTDNRKRKELKVI